MQIGFDVDAVAWTAQKHQNKDRTDDTGNQGCQRRTGSAHLEAEDE